MRLIPPRLVNVFLSVTQCVNLIVQKYASPKDVIFLATDRRVDDFTVINLRKGRILNEFPSRFPDFYVIEIEKVEDFLAFWGDIQYSRTYLFNKRGKFLFIGNSFSREYVHRVYSYYLIKSVFFNTETRIINKIDYYINGTFYRNGYTLLKVGKCDTQFRSYSNFYASKFPEKGEKHDILIATNQYAVRQMRYFVNFRRPGFEPEIIMTILKHLDINHSFFLYETATNDIINGRMDIAIGGFHLIASRDLEQAPIYYIDFLNWFVPMPKKIERWRYILLVFSPTCWMLFLLALLSAFVALLLVKYANVYTQEFGIMQVLCLIFLGRTKRFRVKHFALDLLVFSIVFWSVMMNYLFSSKLTYLLNGISYEKGMENIEDIARSKLHIIIGQRNFEDMVKALPEFQNYPPHLFAFHSVKLFWQNITIHKNLVILTRSKYAMRLKRRFTDKKTGLTYLKKLEPPFFTYLVGAVCMKGHPFFHHFKKHVQYLIESGVTSKIEKFYEPPKWEQPTSEPIQKLKLEHIQAPLMILAMGLMLGLVAFFFELMHWRFITKRTASI